MVNKVLVVDDQKSIQSLLTEILKMIDCEVRTAGNGKEGLRELYDFRPDLIITDLLMPEMDGNEFCKIVRMACDVPIMMLTGMYQSENEVYELHLVDDYVFKPIRVQELTDRVKILLGQKKSKRSLILVK